MYCCGVGTTALEGGGEILENPAWSLFDQVNVAKHLLFTSKVLQKKATITTSSNFEIQQGIATINDSHSPSIVADKNDTKKEQSNLSKIERN